MTSQVTVASSYYIVAMTVFTLGFVFNYVETWYFGWHMSPASTAERWCDVISATMIVGGLIMMWVHK